MQKKNSFDVTKGPLLKRIILFSLPVMGSILLQQAFNMMDSMIVGHFDGSRALAAVGATGIVVTLLINGIMGISIGSTVTISQSLGVGDKDKGGRYAHASIALSLILGFAVGAIGVLFARPFLKLLSVPNEIIELSVIYLRIYFAGAPVIVLYNFGSAIMKTIGDTKRPMLYLGVAGVINVLLNLFFVVVLKMSVAGVALATVISQAFAAILVSRDLLRSNSPCRIYIKKIGFRKQELSRILKVGLPSSIQSMMFSISNLIMNSSINSFGPAVIAGDTASLNVENIQHTPSDGCAQTVTVFVGQNFGAKNVKRIVKSWLLTMAFGVFVEFMLAVAFAVLRRYILGIFIPDDPIALKNAITRNFMMINFHTLALLMSVSVGALRGMGKSFIPMIYSVFGVCILRIIYVYTYFRCHRSYPVLLSIWPITWGLTGIALTIVFFICCKKLKKAIQENKNIGEI